VGRPASVGLILYHAGRRPDPKTRRRRMMSEGWHPEPLYTVFESGSTTIIFCPPFAAVSSDWQLSGFWTATTTAAYTVSPSVQNGAGNQNITGSPDFGGRVIVKSDPGSGCSGDMYRQFATGAFAPPQTGSVGLESGSDYLRGCFQQQFDLALQREIRLGESRRLSFRIDAFNGFNQSHVTGRNTTMQVASQTDPTIVNSPFDPSGNLDAARSRPNTAGFGMVNGYQSARTLQAWLRFTF
jgi:hypothetical protein